MSINLDSFIDAYVQALYDQNAAVFAGAGLSIPAGLVDWKGLLKNIARDVGLDVKKEDDLITVAQFHVNEKRSRHQINQALIHEFATRAKLTDNHRLLASLPVRTYWTTNYDTLIEQSLKQSGKAPDVKITVENLATTLPRRDAVVYKMHGDVSLPDRAVVTKDDYEAYSTARHLFSMALQGDLVSKTFLFIGFSFNDPNLSYILSRIRLLLGENRRDHYCLLRKVHRRDFKTAANFRYAEARQQLQVNDLKRYGIIGLLVKDYAEYTAVLQRITQRYKMARVFISGSAADYAPWEASEAQELIQELSRRLTGAGFGIVSGFGEGVGPYVINGILTQLEKDGSQMLDDRVVLRPFPIAIADGAERKHRWKAYRQDMLAQAGIAVFLFGNKRDASGKLVAADGMKEEFEIASARHIAVIPVGCTGSVSETLHSRVLAHFTDHFPASGYKRAFQELSKKGTVQQVAARVVSLIERLRDDLSLH
ncbi:MAG: SIR2 family protein [Bryobacteraceae bacterium]|nr:SIR2 family protein [Bryobacteraceae bacterium]